MSSSHVPKVHDLGILCCVVLCVPLYGANEDTMPGYSNKMVRSMWSCIDVVLQSMIYDKALDDTTVQGLTGGRDVHGFELLCTKNNESLRTLKTPQALLDARDSMIMDSHEVFQDSSESRELLARSGTAIYPTLSYCIFTKLNINPIHEIPVSKPQCEHKPYNCTVFCDNSITTVCLECGFDKPCSMIVDMGSHYLSFSYEQSTCPQRFLDLACELPSIVSDQLKHFMDDNLTTTRFNESTAVNNSRPIFRSREHIEWGSTTCHGRLYVISMVRPTLNFSTYTILTSLLVAGDITASYWALVDELRKIRGFDRRELRVQIDVNTEKHLKITGTLAHWYCERLPYPTEMISCSIGSSIVQAHRINVPPNRVSVSRLAMSIGVIQGLTCGIGEQHNCIPTFHSSKIVLKFPSFYNSSRGATITLGKNGGFQFMGKPGHIRPALDRLSDIITKSMCSQLFMNVICTIPMDNHPIYPSGISKIS